MAVDLLSQLKQIFNSEVVQKLGAMLGEHPDRVERAIAMGGPSILAGILNAGTGSRDGGASLADALRRESAASTHMDAFTGAPAKLVELIQGPSLEGLVGQGQSLLRAIFGDRLGGVMDRISDDSGAKPSSVSTIMGLLAPALGGLIRKSLGDKGLSLEGLRGLLNDQRDSILRHLPAGLGDAIGLRGLADLGSTRPAAEVAAPKATVTGPRYGKAGRAAGPDAENSIARWGVPAALAALLLLGAYFLIPRAGERVAVNEPARVEPPAGEPAPPAVADARPSIEPARPATIDGDPKIETAPPTTIEGKPAIETAARGVSLSLPGDMKIEVPENSYLEAMVRSLRDGRPAASRTFVASDLMFDRDGKLAADARRSVAHIATIAKAYPGVKFKVNGRETLKNVEPAAARDEARRHAEAVRDALVEAGVPADRVVTEVVAANLPAEHPAATAADDVPISISIVAE